MSDSVHAANEDIILQVDHVTKEFINDDGSTFRACNDVSFYVPRGEITAIVGESGCGKTTLVKTVMNMHPPTSGCILFYPRKGQEIESSALKGEARRQHYQHIQMVFQDPSAAFNPRMHIKEIICEPLLNFNRIKKSEVDAKARELLRLVELPEEFAERFPHNMSGGQRQRVAIARALALEPELVVCDEATSALDVSVQDSIIRLLVDLQKKKNVTYLFICHDLALVSMFAHHVIVMYKGQVVEKLQGEHLAEAKHPYTQTLLKSILPVRTARG